MSANKKMIHDGCMLISHVTNNMCVRTVECEGQVGVGATSNRVGGEAVVPHLRQSLCRLIPDVFLLSQHNTAKYTRSLVD